MLHVCDTFTAVVFKQNISLSTVTEMAAISVETYVLALSIVSLTLIDICVVVGREEKDSLLIST